MSIIDNMSQSELQALLKEGKKKLQATSKPRKANKLPKTITDSQIAQLLSSIEIGSNRGKKQIAMILTMLRCGLRASEVCNLTWQDIDFDKHTIYLQLAKGQKDRYVPMTSEVEQALLTWQEIATSKELVFATCSGRAMLPRAVTNMVNNVARKAGVYIQSGKQKRLPTAHILRHTYATNLLQDGWNLPELQKVMGHSSIQTTTIYTHIMIDDLVEKARNKK